jgi:hypothetical protein
MLEERERDPVAMSLVEDTSATTTVTTTVPSSTPEVIEELSEFTPLAALPLETAPAGGYTIFSIETPEDSTTVRVTVSSETPAVTTVTNNVATFTETAPPTIPSENSVLPDSGKTGETPAAEEASAESGDEVLYENEPTVGNGDTGGVYEDESPEDADAAEEDAAEDDSLPAEDDSAEDDSMIIPPSPVRDNGNTLYLGNFENLTTHAGYVKYTENGAAIASTMLNNTSTTALAKVVVKELGSDFTVQPGTPPALSRDELEWHFELVGTGDSYVISVFENAVTISYTAQNGGDSCMIVNALTPEKHDALFKALYIETFSESAYELYMARETGK